MAKLPLEGVRILDMTVVVGPPWGSMLLANMGAEVIRIESTQTFPSTTRGYTAHPLKETIPFMGAVGRGYPDLDPGPRPWNRFSAFNSTNHNKLSMTVDLRNETGKATFRDLVRLSDVVIDNMPGVVDKLGINYTNLRTVKPDIICMSIAGMGASGPYKDQRGFGIHFEDIIGHAWLRGYAEDHPESITNAVPSDPAAGAAMCWLAIAALRHRDRTGQGQFIDLSMGEAYIHHLSSAFADYALTGRIQRTLGNRHQWMSPHNCYPAKGNDLWINIAVSSDQEWRALCRVMGDPAWAKESRFATCLGRLRYQDEMDSHITAWTKENDRFEMQERLQQVGVAAFVVTDVADQYRDPQLRHRGYFRVVNHPDAGEHEYPFQFWKASATPWEVRHTSPLLGEDNHYVYRDLLGVTQPRYKELEATGHIGMEYAPHIP